MRQRETGRSSRHLVPHVSGGHVEAGQVIVDESVVASGFKAWLVNGVCTIGDRIPAVVVAHVGALTVVQVPTLWTRVRRDGLVPVVNVRGGHLVTPSDRTVTGPWSQMCPHETDASPPRHQAIPRLA